MLRVIKCNIFSCVIILYFAHAIFSFSFILDKDILEISPKQIAFSSSFLYVIHIIQNENLFSVVVCHKYGMKYACEESVVSL